MLILTLSAITLISLASPAMSQDACVKAWQTHVFEDKALGPDYAMWDSAIDKPTQIRCRPAHANSRWVWKCTAVARPCKAGE